MATSILVYEDNDLLRESIGRMITLNSQFRVSGSFSNVLKVEEQVKLLQPNAILMDIDMPGRSGIDAVSNLRSSGYDTPICF